VRFALGVRTLLSSFALAGLAGSALAAGGIGDAYITSDASDIVRAYNGVSGAFLGNHVSSVNGNGQMAIHFGTTNNRFLVGSAGGGVDEFNATTGAFIKTYNPGGGWQWAGVYVPSGNVYIGDMGTADVREYDSTTGAFIRIVCSIIDPSDMRIGPSGNLYICSYGGAFVREIDIATGATIIQWPVPGRPQDIAFLPSGEILVASWGPNVVFRFSPALAPLGTFTGTLWSRPHGLDISPHNGHIYVVDGVTTQVHEFDPVTFVELNPAWRSPDPEDKIVDFEFRPSSTVAVQPTTWTAIKTQYR
jgi:DNA-binding beta-propeller fold protein YncE